MSTSRHDNAFAKHIGAEPKKAYDAAYTQRAMKRHGHTPEERHRIEHEDDEMLNVPGAE